MDNQDLKIDVSSGIYKILIDRPSVRNALRARTIVELAYAIDSADSDPTVRVIVLTGGPTVFAAGADINEMKDRSFEGVFGTDFITAGWERLASCRKPVVAAVAGYALGGGCELAMMADVIVAAESAQFGQPEIKLGTLPGLGGTQRLVRAIGKAKTMELCLTGRLFTATEAERAGLVSRVVSDESLLAEAMSIASRIAEMPPLAAMMVKEAVLQAFETSLSAGIRFERRLFHASFATREQKEGMAAFIEKRTPLWPIPDDV